MKKLFKHLCENKERAIIHCAAGVHRTGTTTYTLLRWSGMEPSEAFESLAHIRTETHKGVGEWRIELAENNLV